eukprot:m.27609 g.27609  ORF g.27609 m.27609 type:complete len:149 (-) comp15774_c1_seq1:124-570(-)
MRLKNRYMLVEIIFLDGKVDESLATKDIGKVLKDAVKTFHGDYGFSCVVSSLQVKAFRPLSSIAVIKVSRDHYEKLWTAMTFITSVRQRSCIFNLVHLAGTIRSCRKKMLQLNQKQLKEMAATAATPDERKRIEQMAAAAINAIPPVL